ncbi:MAG TPA: anthranilate synthase component I family protein [Bacteroidales bacterium]|nr:anthranilate synthase component I family protein [Bacteroidales bacterium]HQG37167.1 anthranilate synthase component I family protein [Bacteroidales bacterium]HQG53638.1 anthranilate synthase component I family protein [Bacteroidales bacterium]HQJ21268.1 anthranilate synthase component I family protein [Bacteroidales bacterium]HRC88750.1 anthranilate synthase component I family protein [Bacteroidales bacterium]
MKKYSISTSTSKLLADTITPVSVYLRIRDIYPNSLLLESSDYHAIENSYSFICINSVASFEADGNKVTEKYPDGTERNYNLKEKDELIKRFTDFMSAFTPARTADEIPVNGFFGYMAYDAVEHFENITLKTSDTPEKHIPEMRYDLFKYIIAINHYQNMLYIIENRFDENEESGIEQIENLLRSRNFAIYRFRVSGNEKSNLNDEDYKYMVRKGKEHCHRGDVFQVVLSRRYSIEFKGDEFNVYRALRSINPSPYLFYFDYGNYKIFGSSPEAHLKINQGIAYINPIAGTYRRTGNDEADKLAAERLSYDLKENSEHIMLVDLARNDLSKYARNVKVQNLREVQFYSHVIHLVSSVSGELREDATIADVLAATFPAGTLTGAPKHMAMQLIDRYENEKRGYYGGAIGFIDFRGILNHAILIRTFLSKGNMLIYQAGAGIVAGSDEEKELQEVNNKLDALKNAVKMAEGIK